MELILGIFILVVLIFLFIAHLEDGLSERPFNLSSSTEIITMRRLIQEELERRGEVWRDVKYCTLTDEQLDRVFSSVKEICFDEDDDHFYGADFTLWTKKHVYFAVERNGDEMAVGSAPRFPSMEHTIV